MEHSKTHLSLSSATGRGIGSVTFGRRGRRGGGGGRNGLGKGGLGRTGGVSGLGICGGRSGLGRPIPGRRIRSSVTSSRLLSQCLILSRRARQNDQTHL